MRFVIGAILGILGFVVALQNMQVVEIRFLFWTLTTSSALWMLIVLTAGVLVGWILGGLRSHRRRVEAMER